MFWRRKVRSFEVLGERFALPSLDLGPRLDRAAKLRARLGATFLERLNDPLLRPFRKAERRTRLGFLRAHRVLSAHEAIVYAALDHVAIYDDALARATEHVARRSREKVETLMARGAERRRVAEKAAHLASRVESQLEADLAIIAERIRMVGRAAHLMLTRLQRYRTFVKQTSAALTAREQELTAQRTLLVHDEHTYELSRELANDHDFGRWLEPDALCAGVEASLRALVRDLDGLEGGVAAVPDAVDRLLARAESADARDLMAPLELDDVFGGALGVRLPSSAEVPERLDDEDWEALERHELEAELVFGAQSVEALGVEVVDWLDAHGGHKQGRARACAGCRQDIVSGAALGRAHVLCVRCRDEAKAGGAAWLKQCGFTPVAGPEGGLQAAVSRVVFESVLGWVPSAGAAKKPVTHVTWYEAIELCNALSRREGRRPAYRVRGDVVTLRRGAAINGWRLAAAGVPAGGALREWRWGRVDGAAATTLDHGLRPIAVPEREGWDRAVPEVREDDLTFRIECDGPVAAPAPTVRMKKGQKRSASPIASRPDPVAARRTIQAVSLGTLVTGAGLAVLVKYQDLSGREGPRPAVEERGVVEDEPLPVLAPEAEAVEEHAAGGDEAVEERATGGDEAPESAAEVFMEEGYRARLHKDRAAARRAFDRAVVVEPEHLRARFESAREAAFARDDGQAFLHLELIAGRRGEPEAKALLEQAAGKAEFARLKRDKRWRVVVGPR